MGSCAANFSSACTVVAVALVSFSEAPLRSPFCTASLGLGFVTELVTDCYLRGGSEGVQNNRTSSIVTELVRLVLALVLLVLRPTCRAWLDNWVLALPMVAPSPIANRQEGPLDNPAHKPWC